MSVLWLFFVVNQSCLDFRGTQDETRVAVRSWRRGRGKCNQIEHVTVLAEKSFVVEAKRCCEYESCSVVDIAWTFIVYNHAFVASTESEGVLFHNLINNKSELDWIDSACVKPSRCVGVAVFHFVFLFREILAHNHFQFVIRPATVGITSLAKSCLCFKSAVLQTARNFAFKLARVDSLKQGFLDLIFWR